MTIEESRLDLPLSLPKLKQYNPNADEVIEHNKEQIVLLFQQIREEVDAIKMPNVNVIRKLLKAKSKKFILGKDFNIGNMVSFGANIDDVDDSYKLIMLPYNGEDSAFIKFRYYPRSRTFVNLFNKLIMALRTEKIKLNYVIEKGQKPNYIKIQLEDPTQNEKFWYILKLWAKN